MMPAKNPACSTMASAAAIADQARVRGDSAARNSAIRAPRSIDERAFCAGQGPILANCAFAPRPGPAPPPHITAPEARPRSIRFAAPHSWPASLNALLGEELG